MGYTHYWKFNISRGQVIEAERLYQLAILECQRVLVKMRLGGLELSGYSANTKPGSYGGINLNGKGDDGHEDFVLREHLNQNMGFNFCKTARKPYDIAVVACLAILKYRLKDYIDVSSDGEAPDLAAGTLAARTLLKRKIKSPLFSADFKP